MRYPTIGNLLSDWMHLNKISTRRAAEMLDISSATIHRITRGYPMDAKTMLILIRILFTDTLFGEREVKRQWEK